MRLALLVSLLTAAVIGLAAGQPTPEAAAIPPLDLTFDQTTRLLVVAPHPDDEAIGSAGLIQRVLEHHGSVYVVLLTSGDGFPEGVEVAQGIAHPGPAAFRGYGQLRERESRDAMRLLGVAPDHLTFLGFPDEGLCRIASTYLFDRRHAFASPYTGRDGPPPTEQVVRGARYRGVDVRRELERIVETVRPTVIALPHPDDEHPDHCSTHIFAREALGVVSSASQRRVRIVHYLVHFGQWPLPPDGGTGATLNPPDGFPGNEGRWRTLALTPAEAARKRRALLAYASQVQVIGRFLLAFARSNELFLVGEPTVLPACWCDGDNVAVDAPPRPARARVNRP